MRSIALLAVLVAAPLPCRSQQSPDPVPTRAPEPAGITATDHYLFVRRGDEIFQFDVHTLRLRRRVLLPAAGGPAGGELPPEPIQTPRTIREEPEVVIEVPVRPDPPVRIDEVEAEEIDEVPPPADGEHPAAQPGAARLPHDPGATRPGGRRAHGAAGRPRGEVATRVG